ncbi:MAG: DUF4143 domain-containing protein [Aeromicrobium sp.]|uniref:ATP-binding protein n=1 Tax=Aeromicrobium sp. TaxID=1871063 RepID=UPI0039E58E65
MGYTRRLVDQELDELLPALPAIALQGPKGVGKTSTALPRATTIFTLDDDAVRETTQARPARVVEAAPPVLIDEWQRVPSTWDHVRRAVDAGAPLGSFILTGSTAPPGASVHSGAGRIVDLRMRPLSLAERGLCEPSASLAALLRGEAPPEADSPVSLEQYADEVLRSGFPGIRRLPERGSRRALDSYLARIVEREFPEQGLRVRRPEVLRDWLRAYAAATATTASYTAILDAATPGQNAKPAKSTTIAYRDVLAQLWLLDPLQAWQPSSGLGPVGRSPKHFMADPALAARLLELDMGRLLDGASPGAPARGGSALGALFEHLVALSLLAYAQVNEARVGHFRTRGGDREIDVIVEKNGRVAAFEVKLSSTITDRDVRHLRWLRDRYGDRVASTAVITPGPHAYRRADGVDVIPAALLGV